MNIQREVGGNLAEILDNVADTLRERAQMRRQVQVLTAEGRLSAWVLTAPAVAIARLHVLTNPDYIGLLVTRNLGIIMLVGAGRPARGRRPLDEKDRGYRCLRSGCPFASFRSRVGRLGRRRARPVPARRSSARPAARDAGVGRAGAAARRPPRARAAARTSARASLVPIVAGAGQARAARSRRSTRATASRRSFFSPEAGVGWDAERVLAFKVIGAVAGFILRSSCR